MEILKKGFPKIIDDNDEIFLSQLEGFISSIDELCCMEITKKQSMISVRIAPSAPSYRDLLLSEILNFHNLFKIRLELSKSIKTSGSIAFNIPVN